jgi:hypothetical protein
MDSPREDVALVMRWLVMVLSAGLLSGPHSDPRVVFSVPEAPRPAYLKPVTDPVFGSRIVRIADDTGRAIAWDDPKTKDGVWTEISRHHYSDDQPWSSDGSLLALQNLSGRPPDVYLDGTTYRPKLARPSNYQVGDDRWHPSPQHPHERINLVKDGMRLEWFDVVQGAQTRAWVLPFRVTLELEMNPSRDGRFVALFDESRMFVVDMDPQPPLPSFASGNQRIGPVAAIPPCGLKDDGDHRVTWVAVSPSSRYVVVHYRGDHLRVFDLDPATLAISARAMPADSPLAPGLDPAAGFVMGLGHSDMTLNPFDGNEDVIVGQRRDDYPRVVGGVSLGSVVMVRLKDGRVASLTDPEKEASSFHVSARNFDRPGWVYVTFRPGTGKRFGDEIVAFKLDGSRSVERLGHTHSDAEKLYRAEPHAVPSRDGRRVVFASNWSSNAGEPPPPRNEIKDYVLEIRK